MSQNAAAARPILYTNPVPLDMQKHAASAIRDGLTLGFAASVHAVPVNVIELPQICHHYPIVFAPDASATPVAVLGLKEGENLFVTANGTWSAEHAYIPSYIRRYPFIFAEIGGTDQLTLCIDDIPAVVDPAGKMRLFGTDGKASNITQNALEFCKSFHAATLQTREFSAALEKSGLLTSREAEIPLPDGKNIRFGAFRIIDEQKWAQLDDSAILEFRRKGWLPAIYAALFSGAQWGVLGRQYAARHGV